MVRIASSFYGRGLRVFRAQRVSGDPLADAGLTRVPAAGDAARPMRPVRSPDLTAAVERHGGAEPSAAIALGGGSERVSAVGG